MAAKVDFLLHFWFWINLLVAMGQKLTYFYLFSRLPPEIRDTIWKFSAEYSRYVEIIVKNNYTEHNAKEDEGFAFFKNAFEFDAKLPGGLEACKQSRAAILPLYSLLDLGSHQVRKIPDIEYIWLDGEDPDPENFRRTAVVFNPEWDTVVFQAGYVLHKKGVIERKLPARLRERRHTRHSQKTHVQHLATTMFPWDQSPTLPNSPQQIVETFPEISTLCVIGQRNEDCDCGYCMPSGQPSGKDLANVKQHVVKSLEPVMVNKKRREMLEPSPGETSVASPENTRINFGYKGGTQQAGGDEVRIPEVRAIPMNYQNKWILGGSSREWYAFINEEMSDEDTWALGQAFECSEMSLGGSDSDSDYSDNSDNSDLPPWL
ncbi:hypothetical protein BKA61DRAFT_30887 [Leptodontidium sp. MPI-SDFR-AT-0119]|nr:hypothetical protein BKA61DRAFT_30887 [Leptodontidium sp. MPI-SDFR-AT-0119]